MNRVNAILIGAALAHIDRPRVEIPDGAPIPEDLVTTVYKQLTAVGLDKINNDLTIDEVNEVTQGILKSFKKDGLYPRVTEFAKLQEIAIDGGKDLVFYNTLDMMGDGHQELSIIIGQNGPVSELDFRVEAVHLENPGTDHEKVIAHHLTKIEDGHVVYSVYPELPVVEEDQPVPEIIKITRTVGQLAASLLKPLYMDCGNLLSEIDTNTVATCYAARDAMLKL